MIRHRVAIAAAALLTALLVLAYRNAAALLLVGDLLSLCS